MKDLLVAKKAALAGAKVILKYHGKAFKIKHKGEINLVTEVDEKSQIAIVKEIKKTFKHDAFLAEEGDLATTGTAKRRWIIDPIDGTTNFAHGFPFFCISIALEENGELKVGVIYDPTRKEMFTAVKGKGAFLNGKKLSVSKIDRLKSALLCTGFPYDLLNPEYENLSLFSHMLFKAQAVRRAGSASLDLAYVASGRFDGFWEKSLKPWDYAAGLLLVSEAGGKVTHLSGRPWKMGDHAFIASNGKIHGDMLMELSQVKNS